MTTNNYEQGDYHYDYNNYHRRHYAEDEIATQHELYKHCTK